VTPRVRRALALAKRCIEAGIRPFPALTIDSPRGCAKIFPVIAELHSGRPFIVDGTHRVFAAHMMGLETIDVLLVVPAKDLPLPCKLFEWSEVTPTYRAGPWQKRFSELNMNFFRPVSVLLNELPPSNGDS
jgi:hypothetical protein